MSDFILSVLATEWQPDPELPDYNPQPSSSFLITEYEGRQAYLWTGDNPATVWDSYYVVGEWDTITGAPLTAIHPDYATYIAKFGNDSGRATADKLTALWQGHSNEKLYAYDDTDPEDVVRQLYPDSDSPFKLKITRVEITEGTFLGWGWTVEMISDDPERDITARAIGVYSDPECTSYLYTTGAFVDDGEGNYYTECPLGQLQPTDAQVNFALLLGSAQEGFFNLPEGGGDSDALFWSHDAVGEGIQEWSGLSVPYAIGDHVMYLDIEYECIQAHTSQPAWTPPAVDSLWVVV